MSSNTSGTVPILRLPASDLCLGLKTSFAERYQQEPDFYVRVPGRVNLIGEHIDYCGYGVCPMALKQDILLAVARCAEETLDLTNLDDNHKPHKCSIKDTFVSLDGGAPGWHQYFLCGVRGILDVLPEGVQPRGMRVMVSGRVPQSAGLSSSSALVSAAALATSCVHGLEMSKEKIASLCATCERYIGTQGGGMDQAIAFLATEGCAKLINFAPLRSEDVTLPSGAVFVIAHSLTRLNKAATADFNCRVVECRLAAQILAHKSGLKWESIKRLGDLQTSLGIDLRAMISLVKDNLHAHPYDKDELLAELQTTDAELTEVSLTENTKHLRSFKLYQRALHVFQEALRVQQFHDACVNSSGEGTLPVLGKLMSESHASLRDLYECSHPQLDKLVELSERVSLGARLTGAGWGGCVVALVEPGNVNGFIETVTEEFYKELGVQEKLHELVFVTKPNAGACVYLFSPGAVTQGMITEFKGKMSANEI